MTHRACRRSTQIRLNRIFRCTHTIRSGTLASRSPYINDGMRGDTQLAMHLTLASMPHAHDRHHLNHRRYMRRLTLQWPQHRSETRRTNGLMPTRPRRHGHQMSQPHPCLGRRSSLRYLLHQQNMRPLAFIILRLSRRLIPPLRSRHPRVRRRNI